MRRIVCVLIIAASYPTVAIEDVSSRDITSIMQGISALQQGYYYTHETKWICNTIEAKLQHLNQATQSQTFTPAAEHIRELRENLAAHPHNVSGQYIHDQARYAEQALATGSLRSLNRSPNIIEELHKRAVREVESKSENVNSTIAQLKKEYQTFWHTYTKHIPESFVSRIWNTNPQSAIDAIPEDTTTYSAQALQRILLHAKEQLDKRIAQERWPLSYICTAGYSRAQKLFDPKTWKDLYYHHSSLSHAYASSDSITDTLWQLREYIQLRDKGKGATDTCATTLNWVTHPLRMWNKQFPRTAAGQKALRQISDINTLNSILAFGESEHTSPHHLRRIAIGSGMWLSAFGAPTGIMSGTAAATLLGAYALPLPSSTIANYAINTSSYVYPAAKWLTQYHESPCMKYPHQYAPDSHGHAMGTTWYQHVRSTSSARQKRLNTLKHNIKQRRVMQSGRHIFGQLSQQVSKQASSALRLTINDTIKSKSNKKVTINKSNAISTWKSNNKRRVENLQTGTGTTTSPPRPFANANSTT